jgi:hypothetical protein
MREHAHLVRERFVWEGHASTVRQRQQENVAPEAEDGAESAVFSCWGGRYAGARYL